MMSRKKILMLLLLFIVIGFFLTNVVNAQCDSPDPADCVGLDPGGEIPLPGSFYFLMIALSIGAFKIFSIIKKNKEESDNV
jgi:hypothetical protein